jgi:hypothetical protein
MSTTALDLVTITQSEYDALLDEQRHWRESAACAVFDLIGRLERRDHRLSTFGAKAPRSVIVQQLRDWTQMLADALAGDFSPSCVSCGKPVRPGDICFPYTDEVSHYDCEHPRPGKHQAGETIRVKDAVLTDEAGNERTGTAEVELYAYPPLFTLQDLQKLCAEASPMCGLESPASAAVTPAEAA